MKKINIEGIAIREGISRNKIMYNAKELEKFAPTLTGKPILKDHVSETDNTIGKITSSESVDGGKAVHYKGWIKEDGTGIIDRIEDGRISEVSIGAIAGKLVKEKKTDDFMVAEDLVGLELSTTPTPGVIGTSLGKEAFSQKEIDEMVNNYFSENSHSTSTSVDAMLNINKKEEKIMSNDEGNKKTIAKVKEEVCEDEVEVVAEEEEEEDSEAEEKLKSELAKVKEEFDNFKKSIVIDAYNKACESKKVKAKDVSKLTMEAIKLMTEMVEELSVTEEVKMEEKPKEEAEPQSKVPAEAEKEATEDFNDYVIEKSDLGGWLFYSIK